MSWWKGYKARKINNKQTATVRNVTDIRREVYYSRSSFDPYTGEEATVGPVLITIEELVEEQARLQASLDDLNEMIDDFEKAADKWVEDKQKEGGT